MEHAAWSGSPRHLLLAAEWCREQLGAALDPAAIGGGTAVTAVGDGAAAKAGGWQRRQGGQELMVARIVAGVEAPLSQPRAKF